jgi:hypothetical protein
LLPASLRRLYHFVLPWGRKKQHNLQREVMEANSRRAQRMRVQLGLPLAIDCNGRTVWIADAHRDDGKRYVVHADDKFTAFLELERAVCLRLLSDQIKS